jgi:hypothetical protein
MPMTQKVLGLNKTLINEEPKNTNAKEPGIIPIKVARK